mmetsp:Transcript_87366/g.232074  ORF Transcript_87366/g.232074 Transcript_87366/m.232074 type:complete len:240 (+) Transcript_87366:174-893(+)
MVFLFVGLVRTIRGNAVAVRAVCRLLANRLHELDRRAALKVLGEVLARLPVVDVHLFQQPLAQQALSERPEVAHEGRGVDDHLSREQLRVQELRTLRRAPVSDEEARVLVHEPAPGQIHHDDLLHEVAAPAALGVAAPVADLVPPGEPEGDRVARHEAHQLPDCALAGLDLVEGEAGRALSRASEGRLEAGVQRPEVLRRDVLAQGRGVQLVLALPRGLHQGAVTLAPLQRLHDRLRCR